MSACVHVYMIYKTFYTSIMSIDMLLLFSQLIKSLLDGENEFVREMNFFAEHHLYHTETNSKIPLTILSQREYIFRNIKDIARFHQR